MTIRPRLDPNPDLIRDPVPIRKQRVCQEPDLSRGLGRFRGQDPLRGSLYCNLHKSDRLLSITLLARAATLSSVLLTVYWLFSNICLNS